MHLVAKKAEGGAECRGYGLELGVIMVREAIKAGGAAAAANAGTLSSSATSLGGSAKQSH